MKTPTKNHHYNCVLASWAKDGHCSKPECENCQRDLTGLDVIEADMWLCLDCATEEDREETRPDRSNQLRYVGGGYAVDSRGSYREAFWAGTP